MASVSDLLSTWSQNPSAVDGNQLYAVAHATYTESVALKKRIEYLESRGTSDRRTIPDRKGFGKLKSYSGNDKDFPDWEFQLQQFLRS